MDANTIRDALLEVFKNRPGLYVHLDSDSLTLTLDGMVDLEALAKDLAERLTPLA